MTSGVTIALTAGIVAADAATAAAATTDRVTTMDRATDLTVGTGGASSSLLAASLLLVRRTPVAAHARPEWYREVS